MNCQKFEQLIALYVEGDLQTGEAARVETHIATCRSCSQFAEELQDSQMALKTFGFEDLDQEVFDNLRRSVMGRIQAKRPGNFWERIFNLCNWRYATASILISALALSAWFYLSRPRQPVPDVANNQNRTDVEKPIESETKIATPIITAAKP